MKAVRIIEGTLRNPKKKAFFFLCFFCFLLSAQDNPFMRMADRKYAHYSPELAERYRDFIELDTVEARCVVRQIEEVAAKTGSIEWKLQADYAKLLLFNRKRILYGDNLYPAEEILRTAFELLEKAKKANIAHLELTIRQEIINYYWIDFKNYELAFVQYGIQDERLREISSDDIPEKASYYRWIGDAYLVFRDYQKAILYFKKALEERVNVITAAWRCNARNGIGLSYRNGYNDLDLSDTYFRDMMQVEYLYPENEFYSYVWNGIAEGNIGYNMLLRGEYDSAVPLFESGLEKMLKHGDYAYASGSAVHLADIYLKKDNIPEAKRYIDLAREYHAAMPRESRLPRIYEVMSKYYAAAGKAKMSMAYMDSTLAINKRFEEQFNAIILLRIEQKELAQRQQELAQEIKMRKQTQLRLLILLAGFIVILALLVLVSVLYRRKRAAYRELVRKSQQWAQVQTIRQSNDTNEPTEEEQHQHEAQKRPPDETDLAIMKEIERLMTEEKIYKDSSLLIDTLAQKLGFKRYHVSDTINRCTKKNFNTFVNEYRIKEAIRLLSEKNTQTSVEAIAFEVGFSDRRSFYRVFKKMTGLSPTQFVNNLQNGH